MVGPNHPPPLSLSRSSPHSTRPHEPIRPQDRDSSPSKTLSRNRANLLVFDDCDFQHWLVIMKFPKDPKPSEEEMISSYVNTLASVVGSEEEAKKKIYSVDTTTPSGTGFGCSISEELADKLKGLPGVLWVFADSYVDVPNKDYGGDLFVDGKVIPRPQYRYNERRAWM